MTRKVPVRIVNGKVHYRGIETEAIPTSHPLLFLHFSPYRFEGMEPHFSDYEYTITHQPSGYSVYSCLPLPSAKRLAEMFAKSAIPWESMRFKRDGKKYQQTYREIMERFWEAEKGYEDCA